MNFLVGIITMFFMMAVDPQAAREDQSVLYGDVIVRYANRSTHNDGKSSALLSIPIKMGEGSQGSVTR